MRSYSCRKLEVLVDPPDEDDVEKYLSMRSTGFGSVFNF
jgi:hypothetical protein